MKKQFSYVIVDRKTGKKEEQTVSLETELQFLRFLDGLNRQMDGALCYFSDGNSWQN